MVERSLVSQRGRVVSASQHNHEGPDTERDPAGSPDATGADRSDHRELPPEPDKPLFQHQPWMAGIVLVFAVAAIVAGFTNPVWWLIGSPLILALVLYIGVRLVRRG
jgi:hypothetical protein